jgi:hypothetical protein
MAFARAYINADNKSVVSLTTLYVDAGLRGGGLGTGLLYEIALAISKRGGTTIELDDVSDEYRTCRNIYIMAGFFYVDPEQGSTMRARVTTILTTVKRQKEQRCFWNEFNHDVTECEPLSHGGSKYFEVVAYAEGYGRID